MPVDRLLHPRIGDSQKIAQLDDRAYRVWTTYLWSADDFGVMPLDATKIQGKNRRLATYSKQSITKALTTMIALELVLRYDVGAEPYICSPTWQTHQKVKWPRVTETHWPPPPPDILIRCDEATNLLFKQHPKLAHTTPPPAGSDGSPPHVDTAAELPRTSVPCEVLRSTSQLTREGGRETLTLTPNANAHAHSDGGSVRGGTAEPAPFDHWLRLLQSEYPPQAVTAGHLTEVAFMEVFRTDPRSSDTVFGELRAHLANQKAGYQWRVKRMVPKLATWLRDGLWRQLHDATPPRAVVSERTVHTAMAADAFVKGRAGD